MSFDFSADKRRVHCPGCRQYQPVMTQERDGIKTLVCAACLHGISAGARDLQKAAGIVKGELPATETVVTLTEAGRKALQPAKSLPEPATETRPGPVEGTR